MWVAVCPVRRADNSTVLVVANVNIRLEAQLSSLPLSLHGLLWESFTFTSVTLLLASLLICTPCITIISNTTNLYWHKFFLQVLKLIDTSLTS